MTSPPFFASDEEELRVYKACGKVALNWGPIELVLEGFLIKLRHIHRDAINEPFPLTFSSKIKQLKALFKIAPAHAALRKSIESCLEKSRCLHNIRSDIVHCICQGTNGSGELILGKSNHRPTARAGGVSYTEVRYSIGQIEEAGKDMRQLRTELDVILLALRSLP